MKYLLILSSLFLSLVLQAQLRYPIIGTYKGKLAQGMAIFEDNAFLFSDGGLCRIYNLKQEKLINEFYLECASPTTHVNNACFGSADCGKGKKLLIYITECKNKFRCFVEEIDKNGSSVVQEIVAQRNGETIPMLVWVVDNNTHSLYGITRRGDPNKGKVYNIIREYPLPFVKQGKSVILTDNDLKRSFEIEFPNILQGCKIRNNKMYLLTGLSQTLCDRMDSQRSLMVIDLKKGLLKKKVDLTYITTNEPEDIDFYKGKCLLYTGQEGGIYEIKH